MTRKIIDYCVVNADHGPAAFQRDVRTHIDSGWQPFGSPVALVGGSPVEVWSVVMQVMVRYAVEPGDN